MVSMIEIYGRKHLSQPSHKVERRELAKSRIQILDLDDIKRAVEARQKDSGSHISSPFKKLGPTSSNEDDFQKAFDLIF